jgi:NAD(P)-dependent dehydrogenase (short-subunit alcohol dehydrogenase family)
MPKVVITGGGRGIGKDFASALVKDGYDVIICSRTYEELRKAASETGSSLCVLDISNFSDVKDFFKNTSVNFDFYFVNLKGRRKFQETGKVAQYFIFEPYPIGLGLTPNDLKGGKINDNNATKTG